VIFCVFVSSCWVWLEQVARAYTDTLDEYMPQEHQLALYTDNSYSNSEHEGSEADEAHSCCSGVDEEEHLHSSGAADAREASNTYADTVYANNKKQRNCACTTHPSSTLQSASTAADITPEQHHNLADFMRAPLIQAYITHICDGYGSIQARIQKRNVCEPSTCSNSAVFSLCTNTSSAHKVRTVFCAASTYEQTGNRPPWTMPIM
jgi:hypothetical protein